MRGFLDFARRAVQRVNARIAVLVVAVAAGGVAVWQGFSHMAANSTKGPTKQIATGVSPTTTASGVQTAAASLTDDQLPPTTNAGAQRLMQYGSTSDLSPAASSSGAQQGANSYLPTSSDPVGGYSSGRSARSTYSTAGGQSGESSSYASAQPSAVPADPVAVQSVSDALPTNPYRDFSGGSTDAAATPAMPPTAPSGRSSYGSIADTTSSETASPAASVGSSPSNLAAEALAAYGNRNARSTYGSTTPPATLPSTTSAAGATPQYAAETSLSPNSISTSETSTNPYASSQSMRSVSPRTSPSAASATGGLNPYRATAQTSAPAAAEGSKRLSAPTPGERHLEGPQQPAITLQKVSPSEIQVGKPATFELYIRNAGQVPAQNVVVTDHVPAGTQLAEVRPQPQQAADGSLVWNLGTMQPGEERQITLNLLPQTEGEIGSTAHVSFSAAATSRSICTRPQLAIEHSAPPKVLIGESLTVGITISNPGTGPATAVTIEEDVPDGLSHVAGSQLEYGIGTLRPGESKRLELSLRAEKPGIVQNTIHVRGEANLSAQHTVQVEIVAPQLQVTVEGPKRRFLERPATYTLQVSNPGTAAAREVELIAYLPRGLKFVETDSQGQYDPSQHAVVWSLAELPPSTGGAVKLTTLPIEPGEQRLRIEGRGSLGLNASGEQVVQVEQAAELFHTVKDIDEVIEVGSETTYEIRVTNKGTKAATNVRVAAQMPAGMTAITGEGPTRAGGDATQVLFEPLARLNPQEEVIYKVQVQARQPGDHLVRVQLSSDEWPTPVTREESTRVYQDR